MVEHEKTKPWSIEMPPSRRATWERFAEPYINWKAIRGALDMFQCAPPEFREMVLNGGMPAATDWFAGYTGVSVRFRAAERSVQHAHQALDNGDALKALGHITTALGLLVQVGLVHQDDTAEMVTAKYAAVDAARAAERKLQDTQGKRKPKTQRPGA